MSDADDAAIYVPEHPLSQAVHAMTTLLSKTSDAVAKERAAYAAHRISKLSVPDSFWQIFTAFNQQDHAFLLDSSLNEAECGRYSFMGARPVAIFQAHRICPRSLPFECEIEIQRHTSCEGHTDDSMPKVEKTQGDALTSLRRLLRQYAVDFPQNARQQFPFLGGAVGFLGYESGSWNGPEGSLKNSADTKIPDIYFAIYDRVLCHDHISGETFLSVVGRGRSNRSASLAAEQEAQKWHEFLENASSNEHTKRVVSSSKPGKPSKRNLGAIKLTENQRSIFDETGYCEAVRTIRQHIKAGDIYQACMTQKFEAAWGNHDPWHLYRELRAHNPAPFACFLQTPSFQIVSASPERYLSVDRSGWAESRPIKGTRPRGDNPQHDAALRKELAESDKDQAENVMIVDLVRNDFGRVCRFGSIDVSRLMQIETFATVFQMVSTVRGQLAADRDAIDLIRATFPGGSMTGAPKIEAMKILNSLEPVRRGVYSGGIGYLDYEGAMDLNMVIRSLIIEGDQITYHAGGGVVADSSPAAEYQESLDKVVALQTALARVCSGESAKQRAQ